MTTQHGTRATYLAGCSCQPCTRANARWCKTYRLRASRSGGLVTVPTDEARDHITRLREHMSLSSIAAAAGTTSSHLSRIMSGKTRRIGRDLEHRILNVTTGHPVGIRHVKSLGAMRRLQSLQALGWSVDALAERLDYARGNVRLLVNGRRDWITSDVDQRIRRLWDELCMTLPPLKRSGTEPGSHAPAAPPKRKVGRPRWHGMTSTTRTNSRISDPTANGTPSPSSSGF